MSIGNDLFAMFSSVHRPATQDEIAEAIEPLPRKFFQLAPHEVDDLAARLEVSIHEPDEAYYQALRLAQENLNHR